MTETIEPTDLPDPDPPPAPPSATDPTVHSLAAMLAVVTGHLDAAPDDDVAALIGWLEPSAAAARAAALLRQKPELARVETPDLSDVPDDDRPAALQAWVAEVEALVGWQYADVMP